MAVLSDYECMVHGRFEAYSAKCPQGCSHDLVKKVFIKAPGMRSDRTKGIDSTLNQLALDFNMTDMNNQNGTAAVARPDPKKIQQREELSNQLMGKTGDTSHAWGSLQQGGTFRPGSGAMPVEGRSGGGAAAQIASLGGGDNALAGLNLPQPKPAVVGRHDAKLG